MSARRQCSNQPTGPHARVSRRPAASSIAPGQASISSSAFYTAARKNRASRRTWSLRPRARMNTVCAYARLPYVGTTVRAERAASFFAFAALRGSASCGAPAPTAAAVLHTARTRLARGRSRSHQVGGYTGPHSPIRRARRVCQPGRDICTTYRKHTADVVGDAV